LIKIDDIDKKLLTALVDDASISVPKLSKKINVNSSVCYSRIKRLVRRNLIRKFTVDVNENLLGYHINAMIGLNTDIKQRDNILEKINDIPETREIQEVTGRFDIMMGIRAKSLDDLHEVVTGNIGKIDGVVHTETFVEMKSVKKDPDFEKIT